MRKDARVSTKRIIAGLLGSMLLLAGCANLPATTVYTYGDQATRILDLLTPVFWMAVGVFVVVQGALVYTVWRFRSKNKDNNGNALPVQTHGNTRIEIAWTIAPAIVVLIIAVMTFRTQAANVAPVYDENAVEVHAIAHQWWFEFQYEDGTIVTAGDMYIPVGQNVRVILDAADVMHNFWIPKLAGKTYMIPGKTNALAFTALEPGIYRAMCAEFCGEAHAQMRFRVIAVEPAEFEKWKTQFKQLPAPAAGTVQVMGMTGDAARGQALFADPKKLCITCHVVNGLEGKAKIGPNLTHYGSRQTIAAGVLPYSTENLAKWLHNPEEVKQGNLMGRVIKPGMYTDQEIADMVAYLDGMKLSVTLPEEK